MSIDNLRPTDADLDRFADLCRIFVRQWLASPPSEPLIPQLVIGTADMAGERQIIINVLDLPFNTAIEKHAALYRVGSHLYRDGNVPLMAALVSEAWSSVEKTGEPRKFLLPEDDPERREVISVAVMALDWRARHCRLPIARTPSGQMAAGGEWEISGPDDKLRLPLLGALFRGFFHSLPASILSLNPILQEPQG